MHDAEISTLDPSRGRLLTFTPGPALDLSTSTDVVVPTHKLRCATARVDAGGGGVNVARVATRLGAHALAVAPIGGWTGARLAELIRAEGVAFRPVEIAAATRQDVSIVARHTNDHYRFVLPASPLTAEELDRCVSAVIEEARAAACVVLSGSLPDGCDPMLYRTIAQRVAHPLVVDTSGPSLEAVLRTTAAVVKPSACELATLLDTELVTDQAVFNGARRVLERSDVGALVVSIGGGGAFLVPRDGEALRFRAPTVQVRSTIGAGDSMVGGIAVGLLGGLALRDAVRLGVAAGTAAVLNQGTGLCQRHQVEELLPLVAVEPAMARGAG